MKKTLILLAITFALVSFTNVEKPINNNVNNKQAENTISISGAFALYPMMVKWAAEYKKLHPNVRIDISAGGAGKGMTDALSGMVDIGMVSREINPAETKKGAFAVAVTKDAVVATVSAKNPVLNDILTKGIKKSIFLNVFILGTSKTWGHVVGTKNTSQLHVYTRSDACGAAETWAKWFYKKQEDLVGVGVFGDPGLAAAVIADPLGIGFNNIGYAYDYKTKKQNPGIRVVPIDLNYNGKIDPDENFYDNMSDIVNAIATNRYPSPPARDLYLVTKGKPTNPAVADFIKWILTDGQNYVNETGYINLSKEKIQAELAKLN